MSAPTVLIPDANRIPAGYAVATTFLDRGPRYSRRGELEYRTAAGDVLGDAIPAAELSALVADCEQEVSEAVCPCGNLIFAGDTGWIQTAQWRDQNGEIEVDGERLCNVCAAR